MSKNALTILGCSGSVALMLLAGDITNASPVSSKNLGVNTNSIQVNAPISQGNSQLSLDPNSDTAGDLAIAKFGCDCPSCRNQVVQMVMLGTLSVR